MAEGDQKASESRPARGEETWSRHLDSETGHEVGARPSAVGTVPTLAVLFHPDLSRIGECAPLGGLDRGAALSRTEPIFHGSFHDDYRPLADSRLSRKPVVLQRAGGVLTIDSSGQSQTVVVNGQRCSGTISVPEQELDRGVVLEVAQRIVLLLRRLAPVRPRDGFDLGLVGCSDAIALARSEILRVARADVPVLVRGETGTGKELAARAIHEQSARAEKPWTAVNVGALPSELVAAELFGSTEGAYTGARPRRGLFRRSEGGTLFLDEIGEANAEVQVALLRVLQEGKLRPVGSDIEHEVDVRVLAATDSDLDQSVATGRLKAPLLQRLAGYEVNLPSLRDRREDIGLLLVHFLRTRLKEHGLESELLVRCKRDRPWLPARLVSRLALSEWPGNVRQLRNLAGQLVIGHWDDEEIDAERELGQMTFERARKNKDAKGAGSAETKVSPVYRDPMDVTEDELVEGMRSARWEVKKAAELLGVSRSSLYALIEQSTRLRKAKDLTRVEIEEALSGSGVSVDDAAERLEVSRVALKARMRTLGLER